MAIVEPEQSTMPPPPTGQALSDPNGPKSLRRWGAGYITRAALTSLFVYLNLLLLFFTFASLVTGDVNGLVGIPVAALLIYSYGGVIGGVISLGTGFAAGGILYGIPALRRNPANLRTAFLIATTTLGALPGIALIASATQVTNLVLATLESVIVFAISFFVAQHVDKKAGPPPAH